MRRGDKGEVKVEVEVEVKWDLRNLPGQIKTHSKLSSLNQYEALFKITRI